MELCALTLFHTQVIFRLLAVKEETVFVQELVHWEDILIASRVNNAQWMSYTREAVVGSMKTSFFCVFLLVAYLLYISILSKYV